MPELRWPRARTDERGFALVMALGMMVVIAIVLASVIDYTASNTHHATRTKADTAAYSLAEAGVNNAESMLNTNDSNGISNALNSSFLTGTQACPDGTTRCFKVAYDGGTTLWLGTYNSSNTTWTVTAWGQVRNTTGVTASVVQRKIVASIKIISDPSQQANAGAWNYVYSTATSNSTTCDLDLQQSVTIDYSVYVAGNLCLNNTSNVAKPVSGDNVDIHVQGRIGIKIPSYPNGNYIGTSTTKVDYIRTSGGCSTGTNPLNNTSHTCTGSGDQAWATTYDTNPQSLGNPISTSDWTTHYSDAQPGPKNLCTSSSGTPPAFADSDGVLTLSANGSNGTFDLTPSADYTCVVTDSFGKKVGEFSWNNSTKTLTVQGVIYFDGSMTISNGSTNVYNGYGTLYLTGTFTMSIANTRLCAVKTAGGGDCDFSGTFGSSSQSEMLVIAANGNDGSGNSINVLNGGEFQGGLMGIHNINLGNTSQVQGGIIAPSLIIGQSVIVKPLPVLANLPLGAPGNPTTHATPDPPVVTSG